MENVKMQKFHADEVILKEGETYGEMYKIVSGSVAVYIRYGEKEEHLIGIYSKPKCFGETNVLSPEHSQKCHRYHAEYGTYQSADAEKYRFTVG